jgi:hypothetical protein
MDIRAFVGHSFNPRDEEVVKKFLKFFQQVQNSHSHFLWAHAEPAEPKILADKILEILKGMNTFIAICTKQERVFPSNSTHTTWWRNFSLKNKKFDPQWKTSDWIIQEIGLAIGRGLHLILLVESGVRQPGGLQGNLEYISFDREYPESSFGKLLEMITALSPKTIGAAVGSPDHKGVTSDEPKNDTSNGTDWLIPKPEWKYANYESALIRAIASGDSIGEEQIYQSYLNTEYATQNNNNISWCAFREWLKIIVQGNGKIGNIKNIVDENPSSWRALDYLARAYEHYQEFAEAARTFENAANQAEDTAQKLRLLRRAAVTNIKADSRNAASILIDRMKAMAETMCDESQVLHAARDIAEHEKNDSLYVNLSERLSEINPGDTSIIFSLAYKYSNIKQGDLALFHYLRIPAPERTAMAWNNLGAILDEKSFPAKAVDAYESAKSMGETLAMSNLSYKLMEQGFLSNAQKECNDALRFPNFHKNIGAAISRISDIKIEEDVKLKEIIDKIKPISEFRRLMGKVSVASQPTEIAKYWHSPDSLLEVKIDGDLFTATGFYEKPESALARVVAGTGQSEGPRRYLVEYKGTVRGRLIEGHVSHTLQGVPLLNSLLGSALSKTDFALVLSDDGVEMRAMESVANSVRFYSMRQHRDGA